MTYITAFVPALCGCDAGRHERSDSPSQGNDRNKADILVRNRPLSENTAGWQARHYVECHLSLWNREHVLCVLPISRRSQTWDRVV